MPSSIYTPFQTGEGASPIGAPGVSDYERIETNPDMFGGGIGKAAEGLGRTLQKVSQDAFSVNALYGRVAADDQRNQFTKNADNLLYGDPGKTIQAPDGTMKPDTGVLGLKGQDALNSGPAAVQAIEKARQDGRANLSGPALIQYDNETSRIMQTARVTVSTHVQKEATDWYQTVNKTGEQQALQRITRAPDDPLVLQGATADLIKYRTQAAQISLGNTLSPEMQKSIIQGAKADALTTQLAMIAVKDPAKALTMADGNKDILGEAYPKIANELRTRAEAQTADQTADNAFNTHYVEGQPAPAATVQPRANYASVQNMGDPTKPGWKEFNIVPVKAGGVSVEVNQQAAPAFQGFLQELQAAGYKIDTAAGYNVRQQNHGGTPGTLLSQHSWGNAIDLNAGANPQGGKASDLPANIGEIAHKWGLVWGGNWSGKTRDPMHFEWAGPQGAGGAAPAAARTAGNPDATWQRMLTRESGGDPSALSPKGAQGLSQLMPATARATAKQMGIDLPQSDVALYTFFKTPEGQKANLAIGRHYFNEQLQTFGGDVEAAVIAYNAGPGVAKKWIAEGRVDTALPKETRDYRNFVLGGSGQGGQASLRSTIQPQSPAAPNPWQSVGDSIAPPAPAAPAQSVGTAPDTSGAPAPAASVGAEVSTGSPAPGAAAAAPAPQQVVMGVGAPQPAAPLASVLVSEDERAANAYTAIENDPNLSEEQKQRAAARLGRRIGTHRIATEATAKAIKQQSDAASEAYLRDMYSGDPQKMQGMGERIAADHHLTGEAVERLESIMDRRLQMSGDVSVAWGKGFADLFKRVTLPMGDPNRISDPQQLIGALQANQINYVGFDKLSMYMKGFAKAPDQQIVMQSFASIMQGMKRQLSNEGDGATAGYGGMKDPEGEKIFFTQYYPQMLMDLEKAIQGGKEREFLSDTKHFDEMAKQLRNPADMRKQALSSDAGPSLTPDASPTAANLPPAPPAANPDAWRQLVSIKTQGIASDGSKFTISPAQIATRLQILLDNPSDHIKDVWNRQAGPGGKTLAQMFGFTAEQAISFMRYPARYESDHASSRKPRTLNPEDFQPVPTGNGGVIGPQGAGLALPTKADVSGGAPEPPPGSHVINGKVMVPNAAHNGWTEWTGGQ